MNGGDDRRNYREFLDGILEFNNAWEVIVRTRSLPGLCESLQNLFGAPVQAALAKQARRIQQLRESWSLRIRFCRRDIQFHRQRRRGYR